MPKTLIKDKSLVGMRHVFDQHLHDKYDIPARQKIKEILGKYVEENSDQYQQNMILKIIKCKYKYLELQVCADWHDEYPHNRVFVYERKAKYGSDTLYLTLNRSMTKGYIFSRDAFEDKPRRLKKYSREFVYDIKRSHALHVTMDEFNKYLILSY
jgi:hypothetical protein